MIVVLAGDWHGNLAAAEARLRSINHPEVRVVLHLGDFGLGIGPASQEYEDGIEALCAELDLTILITPGNHENWSLLEWAWAHPDNRNPDGTPRPMAVSDHVGVLPRGLRWRMGGRSFVSLGGGPSLDRSRRTRGRNWWPEEAVTDADVDHVLAGGPAEVMLTHDSPDAPFWTASVADVVAANDWGWNEEALVYAEQGRARLTRALLGVRPRLLAHGHYHVGGETRVELPDDPRPWPEPAHASPVREVRIVSVPAQNHVGNIRLLDLDTLEDPVR